MSFTTETIGVQVSNPNSCNYINLHMFMESILFTQYYPK